MSTATATRAPRAPRAAAPAAVSATSTATGADYTPRAPQRRGEVRSFTPLRLREKVALVRCYQHDHPQQRAMAVGASAMLLLEHYRTTFPWLALHAQAAGHLVAAGFHLAGL